MHMCVCNYSQGREQPTSRHISKREWLFLPQQLQTADSSSDRGGVLRLLSNLCWNFDWLHFVQTPTAVVHWCTQKLCHIQKSTLHSSPPVHQLLHSRYPLFCEVSWVLDDGRLRRMIHPQLSTQSSLYLILQPVFSLRAAQFMRVKVNIQKAVWWHDQ